MVSQQTHANCTQASEKKNLVHDQTHFLYIQFKSKRNFKYRFLPEKLTHLIVDLVEVDNIPYNPVM